MMMSRLNLVILSEVLSLRPSESGARCPVFAFNGLPAVLCHQFGGHGGIVAVFTLLHQFVTGVAGQFVFETAFGYCYLCRFIPP